jgi:hypothetical protein
MLRWAGMDDRRQGYHGIGGLPLVGRDGLHLRLDLLMGSRQCQGLKRKGRALSAGLINGIRVL